MFLFIADLTNRIKKLKTIHKKYFGACYHAMIKN